VINIWSEIEEQVPPSGAAAITSQQFFHRCTRVVCNVIFDLYGGRSQVHNIGTVRPTKVLGSVAPHDNGHLHLDTPPKAS